MKSGSNVETAGRLAQWRIQDLGQGSSINSHGFKVGIWNWYLSCENTRGEYSYSSSHARITLYILPDGLSEAQPPKAKFVLRVSNFDSGRQTHISPVHELLFKKGEKYVWTIQGNLIGKFIISVEFLDLKITPVNGEEASSILVSKDSMNSLAQKSSHLRLSRMFQQNIHTDITINTAEGALHAHKAVLVASSPVFQGMFEHDLQEKQSSILEIKDMSLEACSAFLNYLYGIIKQEDLWKHRQALLSAADKYNIVDLKECCEESLLEDLAVDNVLERLRDAQLYQLNQLKEKCLVFLFDFGKIYNVRDKIDAFLRHAERELVVEIFRKTLTAWNRA